MRKGGGEVRGKGEEEKGGRGKEEEGQGGEGKFSQDHSLRDTTKALMVDERTARWLGL